jgi:hypothetical protein
MSLSRFAAACLASTLPLSVYGCGSMTGPSPSELTGYLVTIAPSPVCSPPSTETFPVVMVYEGESDGWHFFFTPDAAVRSSTGGFNVRLRNRGPGSVEGEVWGFFRTVETTPVRPIRSVLFRS